MMMTMRGVGFAYDRGSPVLESVDLDLPSGVTLVAGPNGCGKSTLLKIAAGVEMPDQGRVEVAGIDLWRDEAAARRPIAYVPEQPDLTPWATIGEVMQLVCRLRGQDAGQGAAALQSLGLGGFERRSIRELSMGQRRRALLAAAMIGTLGKPGEPGVYLLDEPLEALDREARVSVIGWVGRLAAAGSLLIIVTHEIEPFEPLAARALTVSHGKVRLHEPLPEDAEARHLLLDRLARGLEG